MKRLTLAACTAAVALSCTARPGLDGVDPDLSRLGSGLPKGFLFGAAEAAHQSEGGNDNDWTDWEKGSFADGTPHIKHGDQSGLATDAWNKFDEDLALLESLHATTYRFSVEWSRLEPQKGQWNQAAMDKYKDWAKRLRAKGIEPLVTLFHFTQPKWVAAQGGFTNPATLADFEAFTRRVAQELGPDVDWWCTINEPNVFAAKGWLQGEWPPGLKGQTATQAEVMANLFRAHGKAAKALREVDTFDADGDGKATMISVAHHVRVFQPASASPLDTAIAGLTDDFFNESVPRALVTGHILLSVPGSVNIDEQVPELVNSIDYLGVNYYSRDIVRADFGDPSLSHQYVRAGRPVNSLNWDIYPDGLTLYLLRFKAWGVPIVITENGVADNDGTLRPKFLAQHVAAVEAAVAQGANVKGYVHWSLTDNFEWAEGFEPRFGLFKVDYANGRTRTATSGVDTFQRIATHLPK